MSDDPTIPPSTTPPPPPPASPLVSEPVGSAPPVGAYGPGNASLPPRGIVPADITGVFYSKGWTIFLTIITLGIWSFLWVYRTSEDLKKYNGDGLGGVLAVVIHFLLNIVLWFTIPNECRHRQRSPCFSAPVRRSRWSDRPGRDPA